MTNRKLPTNAADRKNIPLATGFIDYFPDAIAAVAALSKIGNDQHNPGQPLHWNRSKSTDQADTLMRHFLERGTIDTDGVRHSTKVAWRALALLQLELEAAREQVDNDIREGLEQSARGEVRKCCEYTEYAGSHGEVYRSHEDNCVRRAVPHYSVTERRCCNYTDCNCCGERFHQESCLFNYGV